MIASSVLEWILSFALFFGVIVGAVLYFMFEKPLKTHDSNTDTEQA